MNKFEQPEQKNEIQQRVDAYHEIITVLGEVKDLELETTKKTSLAWLIEHYAKQDPEKWRQKTEAVARKIKELNEKNGEIGVTQFLSREISVEYISELKTMIASETNEDEKKAQQTMVRLTEWLLETLKKRESENEATSFGGVSLDHIPTWFPRE